MTVTSVNICGCWFHFGQAIVKRTYLSFMHVLFVLRDTLVGKSLLFSELIHTHYSRKCAIIWSCIFQPCDLVRHFPGLAFSVAPYHTPLWTAGVLFFLSMWLTIRCRPRYLPGSGAQPLSY